MKTNKEWRERKLQQAKVMNDFGVLAETDSAFRAVLDDIDELEAKLRWAESMLERAKRFVDYYCDETVSTEGERWYADLEKGPLND